MVVGVAGSMPVHGIGTACFILQHGDTEVILKVHNCLLCHGEDNYNLLSVSQVLRTRKSAVIFSADESRLELQGLTDEIIKIILREDEGLYALRVSPLYLDDDRHGQLPCFHLTLDVDANLWDRNEDLSGVSKMKAPTKLGTWYCKVLMAPAQGISSWGLDNYDERLEEFCSSYFVPPSQPSAKKTYKITDIDDMADLSIRFMGLGTDRLLHTMERSRGLTPATKIKGEAVTRVPPHNFPQGKWKSGKTPRVTKDRVKYLHKASIAEVCFTDTFETDDSSYRYGQAVVDYRSRYGDILPIRSRKKVGWAFEQFCCRHFTPLILVRDNIAENVGGDLDRICNEKGIKSSFSCPYNPKQNYSEGYLGRVTSMASFAMVLAGAPMFMWRWAIMCAAFINNISATFYKREMVWATPYELAHGEPYPDSSVVVPFGCAVLVLLEKEEREKFKATCAMMIFVHYAQDHPLYTYAVFSPRTKRVLYRQDCIFLPEIFPMRMARIMDGKDPDGASLVAYRHRPVWDSHGTEEKDETSFGNWTVDDPLPQYQDHVTGHALESPNDDLGLGVHVRPEGWPSYEPDHPAFGPRSTVSVPRPWGGERKERNTFITEKEDGVEKEEAAARPKRSKRVDQRAVKETKRRPVKERWFYEPVVSQTPPTLVGDEVPGETMTESSVGREILITAVIKDDKVEEKEVKELGNDARIDRTRKKGRKNDGFTNTDQSGVSDVVRKKDNLQKALFKDILSDVSDNSAFSEKVRKNTLLVDKDKDGQKVLSVENGTGDGIIQSSFSDFVPRPTEALPGYLVMAEDNEESAWDIQGLVFYDDVLGWSKITGWGSDHGTNIVFYTPVDSVDPVSDEQHASLAEVLSVIKQSPVTPRISDYAPSRILRRAKQGQPAMFLRLLTVHRARPVIGTMHVPRVTGLVTNIKILSSRIMTRILKAQETLFKYGTLIPRSDREAELSPEAPRWRSGRTLEWLRLQQAKTFETDWTWERVQREHPDYLKADIGHMFYVYDYKYSGEHRVRLVFDGSRQSPTTYSVTYAPTVRAESVRLFHLYAVEYGWDIQQFDVPQAFLRSEADCTIFVYPPKGQSDFPGQLLKLSKMLYGSKQAAALWFNLLNAFLIKLGFQASFMDPCFYRRPSVIGDDPTAPRSDAIIILHVDDMRVAASPAVIKIIHDQLYEEFQITTSDTGRFLGMDTEYDQPNGIFKMHMGTYIDSTVQRFHSFDLTKGIPYRELVGSLLWIVLCVIGPELLRVKDLAKRSNNFTMDDYKAALKVLDRIVEVKHCGIVFRRGGAGKEYVPASTRLGGGLEDTSLEPPFSIGDATPFNDLEENNLYKLDPDFDDELLDITKVLADTNGRFTLVAYSDASFAVGLSKQSVSGFVIMINGVPILWGSLKQTIVVDSTCSSEYVAASVCCKQILQAENMVQFLDFSFPKPYKMYTDSQACLKIASTASKLGMVRHLEIRYHLVRCIVLSGDILLAYCITEEMLADLFTKIVDSAQDKRLSIRFYNDCVMD
jgi:hypothetical protein